MALQSVNNIQYKEVKYELNTIENLKKAKSNLSRSLDITRIIVDDTNIKFDINPAIYLTIKKKTEGIKKGDEYMDDNLGVIIKATMVRRKFTKIKKENPEASVWYDVTDLRTGITSKCVQHMYHTNQGVHLQGGKRIGKVTTTSMVADYLEKEWTELIQVSGDIIKHNIKAIENIDIKQFETELKNKQKNGVGGSKTDINNQVKHDCFMCDYKSVFDYQMKRHMYMIHDIKLDMKRKNAARMVSVRVPNKVKEAESGNDKTDVAAEVINRINLSPPSKRTKEGDSDDSVTQTEVGRKGDRVVPEDNEVTFLRSKVEELTNQIIKTETDLVNAQDILKATETDKDMAQSAYEECYKAGEKLIKENKDIKEDYKAVVNQLRMATTRNVELEETLQVTENILKAQELSQAEEIYAEDNSNDDDDDDEEDWVEDEPTGILHPAKVGMQCVCKKCDMTFQNVEEMKKHMRNHMGTETVKCYYCQYTSSDGNQMINHISDTHINKQNCLTCGMEFTSKNELISHVMQEHTMKRPSKEKCSVCGKDFNNVEELVQHIVREHHKVSNNQDVQTCATCGNKVTSKDDLVLHIIGQHSLVLDNEDSTPAGLQLKQLMPDNNNMSLPGSPKFKCFECGVDAAEYSELMNHKREKHFKQKLCRSFHSNGYCRFSEEACLYIHNNTGTNTNSPNYSTTGNNGAPNSKCWHGQSCTWLKMNKCKFDHTHNNVNNLNNVNNVNNVSNASPPAQEGVASRNTNEWFMKTIIERLERIENQVPDVKSMEDFPQLPAKKKSQ